MLLIYSTMVLMLILSGRLHLILLSISSSMLLHGELPVRYLFTGTPTL